MKHSWRGSFWGRHALAYHLYLIVLKDNYYRAKRAARWSRVNARLALRRAIRFITGRRWLVPQIVDERKLQVAMFERLMQQMRFLAAREQDNRSLLTGMVVALTAGHSPFLSGWQRYKFAARTRSYYTKGVSGRIVGRPVVYDNKRTKVGLTEWSDHYVPRHEQLAARGRRKYV